MKKNIKWVNILAEINKEENKKAWKEIHKIVDKIRKAWQK